ncbi:hypothetical protein TNCV_3191521 [Trichonephila clavipes]|nr:hypothetical protein TNCV_3191521 [Trichonephila clavipes]
MRGRIIGKIEEGAKNNRCCQGDRHRSQRRLRLWKSFKTTGMCVDGTGEVVLEVRHACRRQIYRPISKTEQAHHSSACGKISFLASGKHIFKKNCCQTFEGGGLYARRPVVCCNLL